MDQTAKTKNLETGIEFIEHESSNNIPDHTCHVLLLGQQVKVSQLPCDP